MFSKLKTLSISLLMGLSSNSHAEVNSAVTKVERPPQFVMLSFDGGLDLNMWDKTRAFAQEMNANKRPLNFTYFVAGVYFLKSSNRHFYVPPKHDVGYSAIGFGDTNTNISARVNHANLAYLEGHEIASKGNGHFDGRAENWSEDDWTSELRQFNDLLFGAFFNNNIQPNNSYPDGFVFQENDIQGFRAPTLGTNQALWPALKATGFRYDTSTVGSMLAWPKKNELGTWLFSVPEIEVAGTSRKTLALDYNFYFLQTKGVPDLENRDTYRDQMLDSYMNYFMVNYYGRRAPIKIGHNFSQYNNGAYWEALQEFARAICGMEEVKCVSYKDYVNWLDALTPETLASLTKGHFEMMPRPRHIPPLLPPAKYLKAPVRNYGEKTLPASVQEMTTTKVDSIQ